jgi:hypothetical protein
MNKAFITLAFIAMFSIGCEKIDKDCPDCIRDKIKEFAKSPICKNEAAVALYIFQNQNVYVFSEGSCGADLGASVYGENCEKLGYLGGIAGNMIINGVKFHENAEYQKEVWHD